MADGTTKPIEDIHVGDTVTATDPVAGKTAAQRVTQLHLNVDTDLTDLALVTPAAVGLAGVLATAAGATAHHPIWDATSQRWVNAGDLTPGHQLTGPDGQPAYITGVYNYPGAKNMRNLTIANLHTYYVIAGTTSVLVHNTGGSCAIGQPNDPYDPATVAARQSEWDAMRTDMNGRAARADRPYPSPISRIDAPRDDIPGSQWHAQERVKAPPESIWTEPRRT